MINGSIAKNTLHTSFVFGIRVLLQAGTLLVLARVLGPEGFGAYVTLAALAVVLGALATFGTQLVLLRNLARDPSTSDETLRLALGTSVLCGTLLLSAYAVLCVFWLRLPMANLWVILCLGVSELLLQPIFAIAAMERHGRGEIIASQLLLNLPLALRLSAALLVGWLASAKLLSLFATGHLAAIACALALAVAIAPTTWPSPLRWRRPTGAEWRDASGYAFISLSASGVAELDKLLAGKLLVPSAAGVYVAASRVVGALILPVMAMVVSAMPRLFRDANRGGQSLHGWLFACSAAYGIVAGIGIWLVAPSLPMLFGSDYEDITEVVRWLAYAVPAISLRATASNVLTTIDRPWTRVCLEMVGWLMIGGLAWHLVPMSGGRGLAISLICSEWLLGCGIWLVIWVAANKSVIGRQ